MAVYLGSKLWPHQPKSGLRVARKCGTDNFRKLNMLLLCWMLERRKDSKNLFDVETSFDEEVSQEVTLFQKSGEKL